jgi:prepilin-type N-terminal cleavage/methylation domain-containing protein
MFLRAYIPYNTSLLNNVQAGFSLVEMAVVLVIMGTLAVGALTIGNAKQEQNKAEVTKMRLDAIEDAIYRQAILGGYMLCPSPINALPTAAAFAVATDCSAAVVSGVSEVGSGTDIVRIGGVPVRSLNLPAEYAVDGWNNRFTYMVIKNMALISATSIVGYVTTSTTNIIQVLDSAGNQIPTAAASNVVPYAIISHGKDGRGAYNDKAVLVTACGATTKDAENCDGDAVVTDMRIMDSKTAASNYFDYVRWKTALNLQ